MTARYRLTPRARDGFSRIVFYVQENFGGVLHRREDFTSYERVLFWPVGPTLVAYRSKPEWVEVLFVEPGEIDWEKLLAQKSQ